MKELYDFIMADPQSFLMLFGSGAGIFALLIQAWSAIKNRQFKKLLDVAHKASLEMVNEIKTNAEKRQYVIDAIRAAMPSYIDPFVNESTVGFIADQAYVLLTKPQTDREREEK